MTELANPKSACSTADMAQFQKEGMDPSDVGLQLFLFVSLAYSLPQ